MILILINIHFFDMNYIYKKDLDTTKEFHKQIYIYSLYLYMKDKLYNSFYIDFRVIENNIPDFKQYIKNITEKFYPIDKNNEYTIKTNEQIISNLENLKNVAINEINKYLETLNNSSKGGSAKKIPHKYEDRSVKQLKELCEKRKIPTKSCNTKDKLIKALRKY